MMGSIKAIEYIEPMLTRFAIADERGRECGVIAWAYAFDRDSVPGKWESEPCEPYVVVGHHATRNGERFGPGPSDTRIGLVSDPETREKAQAEIDRRVRETRRRYARKYGKGVEG